MSRVDSAACLSYQVGRQGRLPGQFEEEDTFIVVERAYIGVTVGESRLVDRVPRREGDSRDFFVGVVDNLDEVRVPRLALKAKVITTVATNPSLSGLSRTTAIANEAVVGPCAHHHYVLCCWTFRNGRSDALAVSHKGGKNEAARGVGPLRKHHSSVLLKHRPRLLVQRERPVMLAHVVVTCRLVHYYRTNANVVPRRLEARTRLLEQRERPVMLAHADEACRLVQACSTKGLGLLSIRDAGCCGTGDQGQADTLSRSRLVTFPPPHFLSPLPPAHASGVCIWAQGVGVERPLSQSMQMAYVGGEFCPSLGFRISAFGVQEEVFRKRRPLSRVRGRRCG